MRVEGLPSKRGFAIEFEGRRYYETYTYNHGTLTVVWYSAPAFKRYELSEPTSNSIRDAQKLLRKILFSAKERGEL